MQHHFMPVRRTAPVVLACGLLFALSACGALSSAFSKRSAVTPGAPGNSARAYVTNLALASFALDRQPDELAAAKPYVSKLDADAHALNHKNVLITILVLEFDTNDDHKTHTLLVPVAPAAHGKYEFSALRQVTGTIAGHKPEFHTIRARNVTVASPAAIPLKHATAGDVKNGLSDAQDTILATALPIVRVDNAELQMELTRFFMQAQVRDAAYITLENAKQLLADADTSDPDQAAAVTALSRQMEPLENSLHQKLPYEF